MHSRLSPRMALFLRNFNQSVLNCYVQMFQSLKSSAAMRTTCNEHIFNSPLHSCGKVMFSKACVNNSVDGGGGVSASVHVMIHTSPCADTPWSDTPQADIHLGRHPPGRHPLADTPWQTPPRHTSPRQTPTLADTPWQTPPG